MEPLDIKFPDLLKFSIMILPKKQKGKKKILGVSETYSSKYFSSYVKSEIGHQILRKVDVNSNKNKSCVFKRFNRLHVIFSKII